MPVRMVLRLSKDEPVRFVSHLDMQSMLQRALRRAGLPVAYTQGFHPHAQISFALALGVGCTSRGEYVDVRLTGEIALEDGVARLSAAMPPGFGVAGALILDGGPQLSALMHASGYRITAEADAAALQQGVRALMERDAVPMEKKGKGGVKTIDIRPMILNAEPVEGGVDVRLWAGAEGALSPALFMRAAGGMPYRAERTDLFTKEGTGLFDYLSALEGAF
jgi:radical SAM-linked protein